MPRTGIGRDHDEFMGVPDEAGRFPLNLRGFVHLHYRLAMRDSCGASKEHRGIEFLTDLESPFHEVMGFVAVTGLQHGYFGEGGIMSVVLLVLRAMHTRVIT